MEERFNYGGQAIIEGVMMRGKSLLAMAARAPDGEIHLQTEPLNVAVYDGPISRTPVLRGLTMLWDALSLGTKALLWSADISLEDEEEQGAFEGAAGWVSVVMGVGLAVGLFILLPSLLVGLLPFEMSSLVDNLLEAVVRVSIIVLYMAAMRLLPDVRRVFAYHGAEHKAINAYEAGAELNVSDVSAYPVAHPRCGTAFLLTVAVVSMIVTAPLGRPPLLIRVASRLVLLPLVAGLSYEFIRFSARHADHWLLRWLIRPSLALQRLTTDEPDQDMVEVALAALKAVLEGEGVSQGG